MAMALSSIFSNGPSFLFEITLSIMKIMIESVPPRIKTVKRQTILEKVIGVGFPSIGQFCLGIARIF